MGAFFLGSREHKATRLSFAPVSFRFHVRFAERSYPFDTVRSLRGTTFANNTHVSTRRTHKRSGGSRSTRSYFQLPVCAYDCRVQPVIIIPR